jgi:RHS repeat-associated protein
MTGYQTAADNQIKTDGTWNYTYDNVGDVIQKTGVSGGSQSGYTWKYAFDNANRLSSATEYNSSNAVVVQELNFYAVNGNRVEQDVTQSGTTTVTKFSYDLSGNVIADLNSTNGVVTRRMFLDATDSVFARVGSGGTLDFYLSDHLGSIRALANTSGTLDDAITDDAWGNKTSESNPSNGDRYGYTDREWDGTVGVQYNRARYFDATAGRWISLDPLRFNAGDSNLYRYVKNNPVGSTDATGLEVSASAGTYYPGTAKDGGPQAFIMLYGGSRPKDFKVRQWMQIEVAGIYQCGEAGQPDCCVKDRYLPPGFELSPNVQGQLDHTHETALPSRPSMQPDNGGGGDYSAGPYEVEQIQGSKSDARYWDSPNLAQVAFRNAVTLVENNLGKTWQGCTLIDVRVTQRFVTQGWLSGSRPRALKTYLWKSWVTAAPFVQNVPAPRTAILQVYRGAKDPNVAALGAPDDPQTSDWSD